MSWILSWSAFAIDQLSTTYAYIISSKNESSVALPGKKVIEKNGVKFMVDSELVDETNTFLEDNKYCSCLLYTSDAADEV